MALNKDGLEPGQAVDFGTLQRIERQRGTHDSTEEAPQRSRAKAARKSRSTATTSDEAQEG